jgi:hypothetical protein
LLDCATRDEDITHFSDKLVFAVQTPNKVKPDSIQKGEVEKSYELHQSDFQSDFVLRNMLDWFKEKESSKSGTGIINSDTTREFPLANFNHIYDRLAKQMKCEKEKLQNEFVVDPQENIKWYVEGDQKKQI